MKTIFVRICAFLCTIDSCIHSFQLVTQAKRDIFTSMGIWRSKFRYIYNQVTKNTPYWPVLKILVLYYYVHLVILSEFTSQGTVWCPQCFTQAVDGITATVAQPWFTHIYQTDEHCKVNFFLQETTSSDRIHISAVLHCNTSKSGQSW